MCGRGRFASSLAKDGRPSRPRKTDADLNVNRLPSDSPTSSTSTWKSHVLILIHDNPKNGLVHICFYCVLSIVPKYKNYGCLPCDAG
jgi:hypothetical protein